MSALTNADGTVRVLTTEELRRHPQTATVGSGWRKKWMAQADTPSQVAGEREVSRLHSVTRAEVELAVARRGAGWDR